MAIRVEESTFYLETKASSYIFTVYDEKYLVHLHYGKRIGTVGQMERIVDLDPRPGFMADNTAYFGMDGSRAEQVVCAEVLPQEYPCYGHGDLRSPAFHAQYKDGNRITEFHYAGYRVFEGKKALKGLPATYAEPGDRVSTLEIDLKDELTGLCAVLSYTVFEEQDAIARSVRFENGGKDAITLQTVMSANVDFYGKDWDLTHLDGSWARERHIHKNPLTNGYQGIDSKRGASSHVHNPFIALSGRDAGEEHGDVYGFSLVYSGNFIAEADVDQLDMTRVRIGLHPFDFAWKLDAGDEFQTPEVVMVYSDAGFGKMSRRFHDLYRTRLCRGAYRDAPRPVLINNWEATYFNFNEEKILNIAKKAKSVGVDLMVLDDGWFGKRDLDDCSLGDWVVDRRKLPDGIDGLANKVVELGMQFGLWFEPEMVSPDSDLFRAHPDWCIHVANRRLSLGRRQLILDLSRQDVCAYIIDAVAAVLDSAPITYVKWDMNRNMTEMGSALLAPEHQAEFAHRYMLGLYHVMETLTTRFPQVLFEGCSGGGGRFDPGMLYYMPQIWTSDDSDAVERLFIQYGTSMVYPAGTMGAHVSAVPNHQVGRTASIKMRGDVAMTGQFGYELDLALLSDEELEAVRGQIQQYKKYRDIIHNGALYRLRSPFEGNNMALEYVSQDGNTVLLFYYTVLAKPNPAVERIQLRGLDTNANYILEESGAQFGGDRLMHLGLNLKDKEDFSSRVFVFKKKQ